MCSINKLCYDLFLTCILNVNIMYIQRKLRILKYWCSLLKTDNCILQACYKQLLCEYEKCKKTVQIGQAKLGMFFILWVLGISQNNKKIAIDVNHFSRNSALQMHSYKVASVFFEKSSKCIVYKEIVD